MVVHVRQETPDDHKAVFCLVEAAFKEMPLSDQTEQFLVERLRMSDAFIPELSLVAIHKGKIVGHIMLSKICIHADDKKVETLCLAPVSVLPGFQNQGIGSQLIKEAHRIAREMGFQSVILVGHASYYPRFGYERGSKYGIRFPYDAPDEACLVVALIPGALDDLAGIVKFPEVFFPSK